MVVAIIPARLKEPLYRIYELRLRQGLAASQSALPRHIAVLCDGNRRWARDAGYDDVSYGYRMGAAKIAEMLRWCADAGIEMATVYLLSTENLQRDPAELAALIEIITDVVEEICAPANRWSVRTVGDLELLGEEPARRLREAVERTVSTTDSADAPTRLHVNVAVGYGGRREIVDAVRGLLGKQLANGATAEELVEAVTVEGISENLYTSGQPDPDLVIRTSGEQRLSGFLLWQSAYSEMWFTEAHWRRSAGSTFCGRCATAACGIGDSGGDAAVIVLSALVFTLSWWLGMYLLARDPRKPVLVLAAVGLCGFAAVVAADAVRAVWQPELLGRVEIYLAVLPGVAWFAVLLELARPGDCWTGRARDALLVGAVGVVALAGATWAGSVGGPPQAGHWLLFVVISASTLAAMVKALFRPAQPGSVRGVAAVATLFFALANAILVIPMGWCPADLRWPARASTCSCSAWR